jgi:hypothetical protein
MQSSIRTTLFVVLAAALAFGAAWKLAAAPEKEPPAATAGPHYSVVETDGAHLIVVDNATNKIYFYTIDKDGKIGDDLKLRGWGDLGDVGKPTLHPERPK